MGIKSKQSPSGMTNVRVKCPNCGRESYVDPNYNQVGGYDCLFCGKRLG